MLPAVGIVGALYHKL